MKTKIIKNNIKAIPKINWVQLIRVKEPYFIARLFYEQWRDEIKKQLRINFSFNYSRTQIDGHFNVEKDFFDFAQVLENKWQKDKKLLDKLYKSYFTQAKKYINKTSNLKKINLSIISNKKLADIFLEYVIKPYKSTGVYIYLPVVMDIILSRSIYQDLKNKKLPEDDIDYIFETIGRVNKKSYPYLENKDLQKLFAIYKNKNFKWDNEVEKTAKNFIKKWGWRKYFRNFEGKELSLKDVKEMLIEIKSQRNYFVKYFETFKKNLKESKNELNKVFKKFRFDYSLKIKVNLLQKFIWLRSKGRDDIMLGQWQSMPVLWEIEKRLNLPKGDIVWLDYKEIIKILTSAKKLNLGILKKQIKERKSGYVLFFINGKEFLLTGQYYKRYIQEKPIPFARFLHDNWFKETDSETETDESITLIQGRTAMTGKVKGVVRIIYTKDDIEKVKRGDILVAEATVPDYVPAMKKSGAIVTDLGGLTSHAAIVSRELGTPCIVGTKFATKVLRDGQIVEVDANRGVVRIIK